MTKDKSWMSSFGGGDRNEKEEEDDDDNSEIRRISLKDLLDILGSDSKINISINSITPDLYDTFGMKLINMTFDHFPDKFQMDYLKLFRHVINAMLSILNSQIRNDPKFNYRPLTTKERVLMTRKLEDYLGHLLAMKSIGRPTTESD